jgi:glycosyltransferase involved in cell wall biosynthesis
MGNALPTVAFDTPPSREILGDLGVYAPRGDAFALADAIAGLLENPDAGRRLGLELRQRVVEHFSWQNTARQLMVAYERAISKKSLPGAGLILRSREREAGGDTRSMTGYES